MNRLLFTLGAILALALCTVPPTVNAQTLANPLAITACGQTLQANTAYILNKDIGSDKTSRCLTLVGPNLDINLNGHIIRGTIKGPGFDASGLHIHNGSVYCLDYSDSMPGCIYVNADAVSISKLVEMDHLTLYNLSTTSSASARNLMLDFGSIAKTSVSGPNVKIHDNQSVSATGLSSTRIVNLQVQGTAHSNAAYVEFYNNATLCHSKAAACQGIVAYGLFNTKIHDNRIYNQLADPNSSETPRGILCDQTDGCEIYNNNISAQDGRAIRLRGTSNKNGPNSVHDNLVRDIVAGTNSNHVAAFHIGDPDSGTEVENATITHNTIYYTSGQIFMVRSATGVNIASNTVVSSGPIDMLDLRYEGAASSATIMDTNIVGGTASNFCESGSTGKVCKSGNVAGVCSLNNNGC